MVNTSNAREYRVPAQPENIRSFNNPHNSDVKIIHAYVRVADFPHSRVPDEIKPEVLELKDFLQGLLKKLENS